ncbi:hypothetical protein AX17_007031 [Amanita inopinata Kibby_2008]|nr:hypothetical protein AX17_007031 [Amanita inopinata Kibby_2008]
MFSFLLTSFLVLVFSTGNPLAAVTSYANDFVNPDYMLSRNYGNHTLAARKTITAWADQLNQSGPWSVLNKSATAKSGDKHDYMSWAPYWWPDCSKVGNTTVLAPEVVWTTCPYVARDGQFNPDARLVNDVGAFSDMSDAVFYDALTWAFQGNQGSTDYSRAAVRFLKIWFLDDETRMNPNLNYAQVIRGPGNQYGTHTGVLDLKCFTKIASAILIFRKGKTPDWTADLDNKMIAWANEYISWLETARLALEEGDAENNHGSFYYNQLAALKILVNDIDGARNVTDTYFAKQYQEQIEANGEQPLEAARTRPYHYRAYNLAAMITNARLAAYTSNAQIWSRRTRQGATIQNALDYAMTISASASKEQSYADELYPNVGAVGAIYGDSKGKYVTFLDGAEAGWKSEGWYLWNQPLAVPMDSIGTGYSQSGGARLYERTLGWLGALVVSVIVWSLG